MIVKSLAYLGRDVLGAIDDAITAGMMSADDVERWAQSVARSEFTEEWETEEMSK